MCNDCHCLNPFVSNPNVIICTTFGMMVSPKKEFDADFFRYYIEQQGVKQIVLVGHYPCQVLEFLRTNQQDDPLWAGHKQYLRKLKNACTSLTGSLDWKKLVQYHISRQVANLSLLTIFDDMAVEDAPLVKGIVIDEAEENKVLEIDHLGAILLPLSMN